MSAKVSARLSELRPTRNEWFESNAVYAGHGVAEFAHPVGRIEGPSKVSFDERGRCTAELTVENAAPEIKNAFEFMAFMEGVELPQPTPGESAVLQSRGRQNRCTAFTVTTAEGIFTARHNIFYSYSLGDKAVLKLHLSVGQFDSRCHGEPRFWVMPLSNFISDFAQRHEQLDRHPLRIYPTPVIPSDLTQEEVSDIMAGRGVMYIIGHPWWNDNPDGVNDCISMQAPTSVDMKMSEIVWHPCNY